MSLPEIIVRGSDLVQLPSQALHREEADENGEQNRDECAGAQQVSFRLREAEYER